MPDVGPHASRVHGRPGSSRGLRTERPLDAQPALAPVNEFAQRGGDALLVVARPPYRDPLADLRGGKEESRLRPLQFTCVRGRVVVAAPDGHRVVEPIAEVRVHRREHRPAPRHVDRDRRGRSREPIDLVVRQDLVVTAEPVRERVVSRRRHADHFDGVARSGAVGEGDGGLARGGEHEYTPCPEPVVVLEEILGQPAGDVEPAQQCVAILGLGACRLERVPVGRHVRAIDRRV
jgi:hypothetical protein